MVKNIPNKYTKKQLIDEINKEFFEKYDYIHLPIDIENKCNVGYCFINFINT